MGSFLVKNGFIIRDMQPGIDYVGVGTCAVCHDGQGRVFLNKRSRKCRDEWGRWDNSGGKVEFGETPDECMVRELREEYGCSPIKWQKGAFVNTIRINNGVKTHWVILTYLVQIDPQHACNHEPEKFEEVGWFSLTELPDNMHSKFEEDFASLAGAWEEFYGQRPPDLVELKRLRSSRDRTAAS